MPSHAFHLLPADVPHFRPLPGHALLRVLPPTLTTSSGLVLPEKQTGEMEQQKGVRRGEVVYFNWRNNKYQKVHMRPREKAVIKMPGVVVRYLGHGDEMDQEYVVVMHLQIVAYEWDSVRKALAERHPMEPLELWEMGEKERGREGAI